MVPCGAISNLVTLSSANCTKEDLGGVSNTSQKCLHVSRVSVECVKSVLNVLSAPFTRTIWHRQSNNEAGQTLKEC